MQEKALNKIFAILNGVNIPQVCKIIICDLLILLCQQQQVKQLLTRKEISAFAYLE